MTKRYYNFVWNHVLSSDETKMEGFFFFGYKHLRWLWCKKKDGYNVKKKLILTAKHGGGFVMLWGLQEILNQNQAAHAMKLNHFFLEGVSSVSFSYPPCESLQEFVLCA